MRGAWRACAGKCARRELARLHLQATNLCPTFDSLQLSTGAQAAIITIAGGDVAVVSFAAACSIFDDTCSLAAAVVLLRVAERRCGAARWRSRRLLPRRSAAATISRLVRVVRASPAAQAALRRPLGAHAALPRLLKKSAARRRAVCTSARSSLACAATYGKSQLWAFQQYRGLWVSGVVLGPRNNGSLTLLD